MPQNPSPLVEFVGLPGVGKTRVAFGIAQHLRTCGILVAEPRYDLGVRASHPEKGLRKTWLALCAVARAPKMCFRITKIVLDSQQATFSDLVRTLFNLLYVLGIIKTSPASATAILDQGVVQGLCSVLVSAECPDHDRLRPLLNELASLTNPWIVVALDAELSVIQGRLEARETDDSRIERREEPLSLCDYRKVFHRLMDIVEALAKANANLELLRVWNGSAANPERLAGQIAEQVGETIQKRIRRTELSQ